MDFEEKGAQSHSLPVFGELKIHIDAYVAAGAIKGKSAWLFQSANRNSELSGRSYGRNNSKKIIISRAKQAGLEIDKISNHTFRETGITNFLRDGGTMSDAQDVANYKHQETTKRCDRRDRKKLIGIIGRIKY